MYKERLIALIEAFECQKMHEIIESDPEVLEEITNMAKVGFQLMEMKNSKSLFIAKATATAPDMKLIEKHRKEIRERENERNTV